MNHSLETNKGEFLLVQVPEYCVNFYLSMGKDYLLFRQPNYETWISDNDLMSPAKINKHLEKNKDKDEWKTVAYRLPDGNFEFIAVTKSFVLSHHEASQNLTEEIAQKIIEDENALDCFHRLLASKNISKDKPYAILKKIIS